MRSELRVFICAGEASGDALGASLIRALRDRVPQVRVFGMGGPRMAEEGLEVWRNAAEASVVGFFEILRQLPRLFAIMKDLAERAASAAPDVAVLIDIPDFNVRLAKRLHQAGVSVAMYVGPSVWAWRRGRVRTFSRWVDKMMVLFPFELLPWLHGGVDAVCVGHPLIDEISLVTTDPDPDRLVALLPGSRRSEIERHLDTMLDAAHTLVKSGAADRFVLPVAPTLDEDWIRRLVARTPAASRVDVRTGDAEARRDLIARSRLALVASGTATLETALVGRPQIVFYRMHWLSYLVGRALMKVPYFGLPNLIVGEEVAPELLQRRFSAEALVRHAERLLGDDDAVPRARALASELRSRMGHQGAALRAAREVLAVAGGSGHRTSGGADVDP